MNGGNWNEGRLAEGMKKARKSMEKAELLYQLYEQKLYVIAFSILHDPWQAEDAVQEAFVKILVNLPQIKDVESDSTKRYIIQIIKNTSIDMYRKNQKVNPNFTVITTEQIEEIEDTNQSVDKQILEAESKEAVNKMLYSLPSKYYEIITQRIIEQRSFKEIANQLHISENTARKRYERGRKLLMKGVTL